MNILTDKLPTKVAIDGVEYLLNTDFRTCLNVILAFEDHRLTGFEKQLVMLEMLYPEVPHDKVKACELAIKFLNCGEEAKGNGNGQSERLYSFEQDAKYIYSAIKQSHNVDLEQIGYLHWWKFSYMFLDLREDCFFNKLIYLRKQKNRGKLTKEEMEWYQSIQNIVDLQITVDQEEQAEVDEFMALLRGNN